MDLDVAVKVVTGLAAVTGIIYTWLLIQKHISENDASQKPPSMRLFYFFKFASYTLVVIFITLFVSSALASNPGHIRSMMIKEDSRITLESEERIRQCVQDYKDSVFFHWDSGAFRIELVSNAVKNSAFKGYLFPLRASKEFLIENYILSPPYRDEESLRSLFLSKEESDFIDTYLDNIRKELVSNNKGIGLDRDKGKEVVSIVLSILNDETFILKPSIDSYDSDSGLIDLTLGDKVAAMVGYINQKLS